MNSPRDSNQSSQQQRPPPVLSFRAFHKNHFSARHRQAFFAGYQQGPFHPSWHHSPPPPMWSSGDEWKPPQETDLHAHSQELENGIHPYWDEQEEEIAEPVEGVYEGDAEPGQEEGEEEEEEVDSGGVLSKEAIAIFEFSRRFREEKATAALLEKSRLKLRRTKRRKLTSLGFALNEGNSDDSDGQSQEGDGGLEAEHEDDEDDTPASEPPAVDTSFMIVNDKQRKRTQQRLYGLGADRVKSSDIQSLEILEDLLNQTYDDSLREEGVVYWPNMPLRC